MTGQSVRWPFATDLRLPGLLHAVIARPPLLGWRLAGVDAAAALRVPQVLAVIRLEPSNEPASFRLGGAAVLARDSWAAARGRDQVRPTWHEAPVIGLDRIGHVFAPETAEPLFERPSATAQAGDDRCTVWSCLGETEPLRRQLAMLLGLRRRAVTINPAASACGPGRISNPAYAIEAALLSRVVGGTPVSLTWTIEDDLPFRCPVALA